MKNVKKNLLLISLSLACVGAGVSGVALSGNVTAGAAGETATFEMLDKSKIAFFGDNTSGIKFVADVGTAVEGASYYMMIVPEEFIADLELVAGDDYYTEIAEAWTNAGQNLDDLAVMECVPFTDEKLGASTYVQGSLTDIQYQNINQNWFAIAYYNAGESNVYAGEGTGITKNAVYVASKLIAEGKNSDNATELQDYIDQAVNYLNGVTDNAETAEDETKADVTLDLSLNATKISEGATLSVNGIPSGISLYTEWSTSDASVATVENGVVSVVGNGTATITVKVLDKTLTCTVDSRTVTDLTANAAMDIDTNYAKADGATAFAYSGLENVTEVYAASDTEKANNLYSDGAIDLSNVAYGEQELVVYNANEGHKISVVVATKILMNAEDLETWTQTYKRATVTAGMTTGTYFVLGADIIATDSLNTLTTGAYVKWPNTMDVATNAEDEKGFRGTFDGRNHAIDGYSFGFGGLFGDVAYATIKNLNITNATLLDSSTNDYKDITTTVSGYSTIIAQTFYKSTLENVYVQYASDNATPDNSFIYLISGSVLKDVVVDANNSNTATYATLLFRVATTENDETKGALANTYDNVILNPTGSLTRVMISYTNVNASNWNGSTYTALTTSSVMPSGLSILSLDGDNATLYTSGGENTVTYTASGVSDLVWVSSNPEVATVENGVVTAVSVGSTDIYVTFTFKGHTITSVKKSVSVLEKIEPVDMTDTIRLDYDTNYGATTTFTIAATDVFGDDFTGDIVSVIDTETNTNLYDNGNVNVGSLVGERTWTVYSNQSTAYTISVIVATKIISTQGELYTFSDTIGRANNLQSGSTGYYLLGADITYSATDATVTEYGWNRISTNFRQNNVYPSADTSDAYYRNLMGFRGTFNGDGYKIDGFSFTHGGLFGDLFNATVKNLAITNAQLIKNPLTATNNYGNDALSAGQGAVADVNVTGGQETLLARLSYYSTIENCYIEMKYVSCAWHGALLYAVKGTTFTNVVVELDNTANKIKAVFWASDYDTTTDVTVLNNVLLTQVGSAQNIAASTPNASSTYDVITKAETVSYTNFDVTKLDSTYFTSTATTIPTWNTKQTAGE